MRIFAGIALAAMIAAPVALAEEKPPVKDDPIYPMHQSQLDGILNNLGDMPLRCNSAATVGMIQAAGRAAVALRTEQDKAASDERAASEKKIAELQKRIDELEAKEKPKKAPEQKKEAAPAEPKTDAPK
jgi:hypothetical protein